MTSAWLEIQQEEKSWLNAKWLLKHNLWSVRSFEELPYLKAGSSVATSAMLGCQTRMDTKLSRSRFGAAWRHDTRPSLSPQANPRRDCTKRVKG